MTMAEKILARQSGRTEVKPGEYVWCSVDGTALMPVLVKELRQKGVRQVFDPDRVYAVEDHLAPPPSVAAANDTAEFRRLVKDFGIKNFFEYGRHGILHELFPDWGYVSPGDLIASADSHSTSYGCFNVASCSLGPEGAYTAATGQIWLQVPESIRFTLEGSLPGPDQFVVGKDVILRIAGEYKTEVALYKSVEFLGPALQSITMPSRFTIANMAAELGAKFAIFPCDEHTLAYLQGKMKRPPRPVVADPDARYEASYVLNVTNMEPYVAAPHDPGNSAPVSQVEALSVRINQAFIGSCTNGRMEDFRMAARVLKGRKIHPDVRLIASPASQRIWRECLDEGIWTIFAEAGALVAHSTCGVCYGGHMGVLGDGEVAISSSNRNFQGRQGSSTSSVYLANAATVAAAAVAGHICDPRKYLP